MCESHHVLPCEPLSETKRRKREEIFDDHDDDDDDDERRGEIDDESNDDDDEGDDDVEKYGDIRTKSIDSADGYHGKNVEIFSGLEDDQLKKADASAVDFYQSLHSPSREVVSSPSTLRSIFSTATSSSSSSSSASSSSSSPLDEALDWETPGGGDRGRSDGLPEAHHRVEEWLKKAAEVGASGLDGNQEFQEALR